MSHETPLALPPGIYIIAVSGGVDSVVLLDHLVSANSDTRDVQLVVAHADHGMRSESSQDAQFVANLAAAYGLQYEITELKLGPAASEATARKARYDFLRSVQKSYNARAIITAHHQDDVIETSMHNLLRGTGRHGLTSLKSHEDILRPLLGIPKKQIVNRAQSRNLDWREDSSNSSTKYMRNRIRHRVVAHMSEEQRSAWLAHLRQAESLNTKIDHDLNGILRRGQHKGRSTINRSWFCKLPHVISREVVVAMLHQAGATDIDRKSVERLVVAIKVLPHGKIVEVGGLSVRLSKRSAHFEAKA